VNTEEIEVKAMHSFTIKEGEGWIVARYKMLDTQETFVAVGSDLPDAKDVTAVLYGKWETNKYGKRFKVASCSVELPTSMAGISSYLQSLKVGIGPKKAVDIYKRFGERVWSVLDKEPARLLDVPGISQSILDKLKVKLRETNVMRDIISLIKGAVTITPKQASALASHFGSNAVDIIKHETFRLCEVQGFGFPTVDKLAKALKSDPTDKRRLLAAIDHLLDEAAAHGHTCVQKDDLLKRMLWLLNAGLPSTTVTADMCMDAMNDAFRAGLIKRTCHMLYSTHRYEQEAAIASHLARLMRNQVGGVINVEKLITQYEKDFNIELADSQKDAIRKVFRHKVNIITGGPGTGKTTVIKAILNTHRKVYGTSSEPFLLAPTGRAARRMAEATGYEAQTIHAAIGYTGEAGTESMLHTGQMLEANLIIIDEFSMADQFITSALLSRIPDSAKVVFVGDPDQLPSVGCGNVLHEMIRSEKIPTTKLDVIFRQAHDNPIVSNSLAIKEGETNLTFTNTFRFFLELTPADIFKKACMFYVKCVKAYGLDNVILLNPFREKTELSVKAFNLQIQSILNPKKENDLFIKSRDIEFRIGDRVMQTKNTETAKNGDVGYIKDIIRKVDPDDPTKWLHVAMIEFNDDGIRHAYQADQMAEIDLAYCTTVHKAQGSEYETVIIVMSEIHEIALRRNLIYTAVTRAKKNVAIIGEESALVKAILNDKTDARHTLLADRLYALLKQEKAAS
jgi:exodeoxyribonuclease V alpha subunit